MREFIYIHLNKIMMYDYSTYRHSLRVAQISQFIGECIGLNAKEKNDLRHAALLHDIGKIKVPIYVLNKGGPLSQRDWEVLHAHPQYGSRILNRHSIPVKEVISGVISHHEQYNGCGYPAGIKGEDIPIFGRIIAVADTLDAMITPRCYRPVPFGFDEAIREIEKMAGSQFDPYIVQQIMTKDAREQYNGLYKYRSHCIS